MRRTGARCDLLGDETGLRSDDVRGRSYAPQGQTSTVLSSHRRIRLGLISAVSNKCELRWMVPDSALEATGLIRFLQRLPWPGWPAACRYRDCPHCLEH
jgi:DDE superfamily endonuclease